MNGLVFVVLLVAVGMGATSLLYRWRASRLIDNAAAARGELPRTPEGRLDRWLDYGRVLIHQRLVQLRLASDRPWLVTHTLGVERNAPDQAVWGVDLSDFSVDSMSREGLQIVIALPAAKRLGQGTIESDQARSVPHYRPGQAVPDPDERAEAIVTWAVERLASALEKDIPGASLVVRIGGAPPRVETEGENERVEQR